MEESTNRPLLWRLTHCGYEFPRRLNPVVVLPFCTESEITHDLHHRYGNVNFGGAYFFWDRLMGTWTDPEQATLFIQSKAALEKSKTL